MIYCTLIDLNRIKKRNKILKELAVYVPLIVMIAMASSPAASAFTVMKFKFIAKAAEVVAETIRSI